MYKDILKLQQPVVYRTLHNGLVNNKLSHCYLFVGDKGTGKQEMAILLAQSLICENTVDGFACEQCISCNRIEDKEYFDFIYIDGSKETIKIDDINRLQQQFNKTALEIAGKKVFVVNSCDNMTAKAANSLLKFIEEPSSEITGIFITDAQDRLLPTIVSRCQILNFKPLSKDAFYRYAIDLNQDELNAHLLSQFVTSVNDIEGLSNDPAYLQAIIYFTEFMNELLNDPKNSILYLQNNSFKVNAPKKEEGKKKEAKPDEKKLSKACLNYFLDIASVYGNDLLHNYASNDATWSQLLEKGKQKHLNAGTFLKIISSSRDSLNRSANQALVVDMMLYQLMEEQNERN